jgi:hypothetical protein
VDGRHDVPAGDDVDGMRLEDPGARLIRAFDGDQSQVDPRAMAAECRSLRRVREVDRHPKGKVEGLAESFDVLAPSLLDVDPQQPVPREALEDPIVDLDGLVAALGVEEPRADTGRRGLRGQRPRPRMIAATSARALIAVSRTRIETSLTLSERAA